MSYDDWKTTEPDYVWADEPEDVDVCPDCGAGFDEHCDDDCCCDDCEGVED